MKEKQNRVIISSKNQAICRIEENCRNCGMCKLVCNSKMGIEGYYDLEKEDDNPICINCGQCVQSCSFNAIIPKSEIPIVEKNLLDREKIVVFSIAPAVRVALGELFGLQAGVNVEKKIVTALKLLGAKYVFDITFGADLTIMEEASEFVERLKENCKLPQFTSCCPSWVQYLETFMPELKNNLSTTKSPVEMQGAVIKTYFSNVKGIDKNKIFSVAIVPCTAKKVETKAGFINGENCFGVDAVLTTTEIGQLFINRGIDLRKIKNSEFDKILGRGSGAGIIFGHSGGVMEATLRTVFYLLNKINPPKSFFNLKNVEKSGAIKEGKIDLIVKKIDVAVIYGTAKAREYIIANRDNLPQFIEVMACPCGCVGGGGQPKYVAGELENIINKRIKGLKGIDNSSIIRVSYKNPEIINIYNNFLGFPLSSIAKKILHKKD